MNEFEDNERDQMAKVYKHAFKRGNMIWVRGTQLGKYQRIATGKVHSIANMNWVEKNWEILIQKFIDEKNHLLLRETIPTLDEYTIQSFAQQEASRRFYITDMYKRQYRDFISPIFGSTKIDEIKVGDIKKWYGYLTKKINTHKYATNIRTVFSTILSDAIEDEYLDKNVVKSARFPKKDNFKNLGQEEVKPFSLDEVYTLIDNAEGQFKNLITYQFFTSTRPGEMIALTWKDIDFEKNLIYINKNRQSVPNPETGKNEIGPTKTGLHRSVTMLPIVKVALEEQHKITGKKKGFVFLTIHGEPYMDTDGLRKRQWAKLLKKCSIDDRTFYQTRHTFASIFLSKGEDLTWISKIMLGHTQIETTLRYYAKYIEQQGIVRGSFLTLRTNHVQVQKSEIFPS